MIDETLFEAEEKMEKAVHVARDELGEPAHRAGEPEQLRPDGRRLLRLAHSDPAARVREHPRGANGGHQAL